MKSLFVLLILFLHLEYGLTAQNLNRIDGGSDLYSSYSAKLDSSLQTFIFPQKVSSMSVEFAENGFVLGFQVVIGRDSFSVMPLLHPQDGEGQLSELIIFDKPVDKFKILNPVSDIELTLHVNHLPAFGTTPKGKDKNILKSGSTTVCEGIDIVTPEIWRDGLEGPVAPPSETQVKHVVVHHSAGANNYSSAVDVVRNIYLFHTKPPSEGGRGFNDIAYNYLIGNDGSIFQGRDDQGLFDPDNVLGAHFCAKNSNTMGVCLMGTFSAVRPSFEMAESLYGLISWKLRKESLSPFSSSQHPISNPDRWLQVVAGHRQGCGSTDTSAFNTSHTLCPGDSVAHMLGEMRNHIYGKMQSCDYVSSIEEGEEDEVRLWPMPASAFFKVYVPGEHAYNLSIYTSEGVLKKSQTIKAKVEERVNIAGLASGLYFVYLETGGLRKVRKLIKQ
ncbi:N-acetylmuramoyl-L-alanine amidase [Cytophagaceae bacterium ABcell3]|nr:N-acetylmuramoyl-L-alanine amidase [Cytophagaceae bacterium ABcell3]